MKIFKGLILAAGALSFVTASQPASSKLNSCEGPIVFGTTMSLTGNLSSLADSWKRMTKVFEEEFNKTGGVKLSSCGGKRLPIKFVIYDDQSVPATAVVLYERMITVDKVDLFVGPDWSSLGFPVSQVFEKYKIPSVMSNVAAPGVYKRGFKYISGLAYHANTWSKNYFALLETVNPKPKTIFWVVHDNVIGKVLHKIFKPYAAKQGIETVGEEFFASSTKDFTGLILKIKAAKPDIIYISALGYVSVPLIQQMRRLNVKAMDVHHIMAAGSMARKANMEGVSSEIYWHEGIKGPYSDLLVRVLEKAKVKVFDYLGTGARLDAYLVMIQAIERAGAVDREKVATELRKPGAKWQRPGGEFDFDEGGLSNIVAFTHQIQNGVPVVVAPADKALGKFIWPAPTWQ